MGVKKTGDWSRLKSDLGNNLGIRMATELRKATIKNAIILAGQIKKGIINQAPGGKKFEPLSPSTISAKNSSKALIDEGDLVASITQKIMNDKAIVGLLKGATNRAGDDLVNIGAVMEYGATINHPNGGVIIIPPRPFLHPVFDEQREAMIETYRAAIRRAIGKS